jgi:PAS domain S-box-containing protein
MSRRSISSPRVGPASEVAQLRARLAEAEETLQAIRNGEVDALVIRRPEGERVFTLQGADAPYRFLIEEMSQGALLLGPEGTVHYANAQFARWIGLPLGQVIGSAWDRFFAPGARAPLQGLLQAARETSVQADLHLLSEDGTLRPVGISLSWLEREQIKGFSVVVTDQSPAKQAEERLRESLAMAERREERFRAFFHTPAVGTAELGPDGRFLEVNERLSQITGGLRD